jgi:hypothetical protein
MMVVMMVTFKIIFKRRGSDDRETQEVKHRVRRRQEGKGSINLRRRARNTL